MLITQKINEETPSYGTAYPFSFLTRDALKTLVAGVNGSVIFGTIYTDQLWVDKAYRKQGLGKKLMEQVHDYGRKVGCTQATVTTMSFQHALAFYASLGYTVDFEGEGYTNGSRCIYLRKSL